MEEREFNGKIEFTNNGQLSLFFLGTGNAFSHDFFQTNVFVVKGNTHLLIDCGSLCPYIFDSVYKSDFGSVQNLLVTHPHADHVGGVEELVLTSKYIKQRKINLVIPNEYKKKLWNHTLKGGIQYSEYGLMHFSDYFNQIKPEKKLKAPFEMYDFNLENLNLKLFRTRHVTSGNRSLKHSQYSYGVILDNKVLFTGDTQFNKNQLMWILQNFQIECIFHDCDVNGKGSSVHTPYEMLKTLDKDVRNRMLLNHYDKGIEKINPKLDGFIGFTQKGIYYDFGR